MKQDGGGEIMTKDEIIKKLKEWQSKAKIDQSKFAVDNPPEIPDKIIKYISARTIDTMMDHIIDLINKLDENTVIEEKK